MNEILREIEEDMRRERMQALWGRFGKAAVAFSVIVVLATIGEVLWHNHKESDAIEQTTQVIKGNDRLKVEDYQGAVAVFGALAENASSPFYEMAMLRKGEAQLLGGDKEAAVKTYQALAAHKGIFSGLAGMLASDNGGNAPVKVNDKDVFYFTVGEWQAWQLIKQDKKDEAVRIFANLWENTETPRTIHERVGEALQHFAPEKLNAEKLNDEKLTNNSSNHPAGKSHVPSE